MSDPINASKAYLDAARALQSAGGGQKTEEIGGFGDMVQSALVDAARETRNAEMVAARAMTGRADLVDVVTAVAAAETTLETVIAVRDEVIRAYQDILRMPI